VKGESVSGIFMAGDRLLATVSGFSVVFATALFPSVSRLTSERSESLERLCSWAMRMVFISFFPMASLIYIFSDQIISLAFGDKFSASAAMLRIGCWSLVLFGFNRVLSILLIASYRQGELVRARIGMYICYVLLSFLLVWKFSYLGLAWAKVITEAGLLLLTFSLAIKVSSSISIIRHFLVPVALCLLFIFGFAFAGVEALYSLLFFSLLFPAIAVVFKIVRPDDLKALKIWIGNKSSAASA
jgi:O-antigen/teichoic acid export membrane protein